MRDRQRDMRKRESEVSLMLGRAVMTSFISVLILAALGTAPSASAFFVMAATKQVHICTNKSCRKAGARTTLDTFRALAPLEVDVVETGCQGKCGLGPNILTKPLEQVYQGVSKPATAAAIIEIDFSFAVPDALVGAFGHIPEGDMLYQRGLHAEAMDCYNKCLETAVAFEGSTHALSVAKLKQSRAMRMLGNKAREGRTGADARGITLEDAEAAAREAMDLWPANAAAWLHLSDVLVDMGRVDDALANLSVLKERVPDAKFEASEKAARIRRG